MTRISADWLQQDATAAVMRMLGDAGHRALFVGGCVRNVLLGVPVADLDISTDALPDQVIALAKAAGLHAIPTGYEHGTVTIMSGGIPHEVTTFRKDVETDGRRAVVAFSLDVADDARRRDFTMNALYADMNGNVLDPLGGLPDLRARTVRFIEDADQRIKEDYLRSLRFFRFHAWYGDPVRGLDSDALAAISMNLGGLDTLSKERVGSELLKLLTAPDPAPAVAAMEQTGVLTAFLPGANSRALPILIHAEGDEPADPIRRLAVLGGEDVADKLRLSKRDNTHLSTLRNGIESGQKLQELAYREGRDAAVNIALLRAAIFEMPVSEGFQQIAESASQQVFPVTASDLMPDFSGPELGEKLKEIENRWIHSDFELTRSQLLP